MARAKATARHGPSRLGPAGRIGIVLAAAVLSAVAGSAAAEPKKGPHLDYRRTYAEALLEARARNVPIFVSRHKDE